VVLLADPQLTTLLDLTRQQHFKAERGLHGEGSDRTGKSGEAMEIRVPPGTIVRDADTGELLGELMAGGERLIVARGGRGGRGNARFATATHQAPRRWEPGEEGEERRIELELKLIADVGLVGQPNAGKSTLLAAISEAHPKVADYPFTTLTPNLGVVPLPDFRSFVVADIPGIIEGAHEGKGLGLQFLRHIERTRTLAFLIPADAEDLQKEYDQLRQEVENYSTELARTPHCVVVTKVDLFPPDTSFPSILAPEAWGVFKISSVSRIGLGRLLEGLYTQSHVVLEKETPAEEEEWWVPE
jgi:GTP-binding protein